MTEYLRGVIISKCLILALTNTPFTSSSSNTHTLLTWNLNLDTNYLSRWDHFYTLKEGSPGCIHLSLFIYEAAEGNVWIEYIYSDILVVTNMKISFEEKET